MSYETLVEQIKTLPDVCLEDISKYVQFLMYQYGHEKMSPLKDAFEEIESRFI